MKTEHTPGPWIVRDDQIQDIHGNTIADIPKRGYWNTNAGMVYEDMPWEANARLIAAAPEMYDALRDLYNASVLKGMAFDTAWQNVISLYEKLTEKIEGDE